METQKTPWAKTPGKPMGQTAPTVGPRTVWRLTSNPEAFSVCFLGKESFPLVLPENSLGVNHQGPTWPSVALKLVKGHQG